MQRQADSSLNEEERKRIETEAKTVPALAFYMKEYQEQETLAQANALFRIKKPNKTIILLEAKDQLPEKMPRDTIVLQEQLGVLIAYWVDEAGVIQKKGKPAQEMKDILALLRPGMDGPKIYKEEALIDRVTSAYDFFSSYEEVIKKYLNMKSSLYQSSAIELRTTLEMLHYNPLPGHVEIVNNFEKYLVIARNQAIHSLDISRRPSEQGFARKAILQIDELHTEHEQRSVKVNNYFIQHMPLDVRLKYFQQLKSIDQNGLISLLQNYNAKLKNDLSVKENADKALIVLLLDNVNPKGLCYALSAMRGHRMASLKQTDPTAPLTEIMKMINEKEMKVFQSMVTYCQTGKISKQDEEILHHFIREVMTLQQFTKPFFPQENEQANVARHRHVMHSKTIVDTENRHFNEVGIDSASEFKDVPTIIDQLMESKKEYAVIYLSRGKHQSMLFFSRNGDQIEIAYRDPNASDFKLFQFQSEKTNDKDKAYEEISKIIEKSHDRDTLLSAVVRRPVYVVELSEKNKAPQDRLGRSELHFFAEVGKLEAFDDMKNNNKDIPLKDDRGFTVLQAAIIGLCDHPNTPDKHLKIIHKLLMEEKNPDQMARFALIKLFDSNSFTGRGARLLIEKLQEWKINIFEENEILIESCKKGNLAMMNILLKKGPGLYSTEGEKQAIFCQFPYANSVLTRLLEEKKAHSALLDTRINQNTVIMEMAKSAESNGNLKIIIDWLKEECSLEEMKAFLNQKNEEGDTVAHIAIKSGNLTAYALLDQSVDHAIKNASQLTVDDMIEEGQKRPAPIDTQGQDEDEEEEEEGLLSPTTLRLLTPTRASDANFDLPVSQTTSKYRTSPRRLKPPVESKEEVSASENQQKTEGQPQSKLFRRKSEPTVSSTNDHKAEPNKNLSRRKSVG